MKEKEFNNKNNSHDVKILVLFFEMSVILLACAACLLILMSSLPVILKTAAFGLFAFVVRMLVKHLTASVK